MVLYTAIEVPFVSAFVLTPKPDDEQLGDNATSKSKLPNLNMMTWVFPTELDL